MTRTPRPLRLVALDERSTPAVVALTPVADNTLYEDPTGQLSDGAGQHLYVGDSNQSTASQVRRALLRFDLSGIPAGSTINGASLTLHVSKTNNGPQPVDVHRALAAWGEGTSNAAQGGTGSGEGDGIQATTGDATWTFRFFNTQAWITPGGDFDPTPSATASVGGIGSYTWTGPGLLADVEQWFNTPAANFGWLVTGNEATHPTAKQVDSRENSVPANRPTLTIDFTAPPSDLTVTKSHAGNFTQGDSADSYAIIVTNAGPGPTAGTVAVIDPLPAGLSPTAADSGTVNGWTLTTTGQTVTATRGDVLAPGGSYPPLTITVAVADTAPASVVNAVTVSGGGEQDTDNDSASDPTTVDPAVPNRPPVNTLPTTFTGTEDTALALAGISVADPDAGLGTESVTLAVSAGTLTVATGVMAGQVTGNGTASVTLTAPLSAINATLADPAGLVYMPAADANGDVSLTMVTDDGGHAGLGGPQTDADGATIAMSEVNDPPRPTDDVLVSADGRAGTVTIPVAGLLANDTPGPANEAGQGLSVVAVGNAVGGVATLSGSDVLFVPAAGFVGMASFDYTLRDDGTTGGQPDPRTAVGRVSFGVSPPPAVRLQVATPPAAIRPGAAYTYLIALRNLGPQSLGGAALVVTLPANATFNPAASTPGWTALGGGRYRLDLGDLAQQAHRRVRFAVRFGTTPVPVAEVFRVSLADPADGNLATRTVSSLLTAGRFR